MGMKKAKLLLFMTISMFLCFACAKENEDDEKQIQRLFLKKNQRTLLVMYSQFLDY